jgi:hypothetical protein
MDFQVKVELLGTVKHALAFHPPPSQNRIITTFKLLTTKSSGYHEPHFRELEYFVHCVRHNLLPCTSGSDALKDLEAISSAYRNQIPLKNEDTEMISICSQGD